MAKVRSITTRAAEKRQARPTFVHQFLVVLGGTDPLVWRRIQVPEKYSFWDLHVAIQDAMGWQHCHLHEFRLLDADERLVSIGIPMGNEAADRPVIPGWQVPVSRFFDRPGWHTPPALYAYDFGDDWAHAVVHEGLVPSEPSRLYPRCTGGERRCPPEDCGGPHGFTEFVRAIRDRRHPEHKAMLEWAGGDYDPEDFDPAEVTFDDPKTRWKKAFGG